ncbi:MAG: glycosyltransferase family 4 protein [Thermoguttaceae bacterium]|nr:glycosyltransferase family 4 protein [Thermoguttaceae bacterium]
MESARWQLQSAKSAKMDTLMNILFLSQFFDPEPTLLTVPFVQKFAAMGHHVEVLTGYPNYPDGKIYPGYRQRLRTIENYGNGTRGEPFRDSPKKRENDENTQNDSTAGVRVIRVPLYPNHSRSAMRRILNLSSFALSAATLGQLGVTRPDVVFVYTLPTLGVAATLFQKFRGSRIVIGAFDLWPDSLFDSGMLGRKTRWSEKFVGSYCWRFYQRADRILVHSPGIAAKLVERGIPSERIETFYLWCSEPHTPTTTADTDSKKDRHSLAPQCGDVGEATVLPNEVPPAALSDAARASFDTTDFKGLTVTFTGNMGPMQGIDSVLQAAKILQSAGDAVRFRFVGGGVSVPELVAMKERLGLTNVAFVPPVRMSEIPAIQAASDLMLVHLRDIPLYRSAIPSKIQYALYGGIPILCGVAGDAADFVRMANAGIIFDPENPASLVAAIRKCTATPPVQLRQMGQRGRDYYEKNLHSDIAAQRLETIFRQLVET